MPFDAKQYWEKRLGHQFDLCGTGTQGFSRRYIQLLYRLKERALWQSIYANNISVSGKSILDVGSGTGFFIEFYSRFQPEMMIGLDITQVSVDRLTHRYPAYQFVQADIGEPLELARRFDIINAQDVFYHIVDDQRFDQALENLERLSHPGTSLFFSELFESETIAEAPHVRFRSQAVYQDGLRRRGFRILDVRPIYCLMNRPFLNLPLRLLNPAAPLLYVADRLLLKLGCERKNNTKLITCQRSV
jgi:SAM-dependent methyltransferase